MSVVDMHGALRVSLVLTAVALLAAPGALALEVGLSEASSSGTVSADSTVATPTSPGTGDDADGVGVESEASVTTAHAEQEASPEQAQALEDRRARVYAATYRVLQPVPYDEEYFGLVEAASAWLDEQIDEQGEAVDVPEESVDARVQADAEASEGVAVEAEANAAGQTQSVAASDAEARAAVDSASASATPTGWGSPRATDATPESAASAPQAATGATKRAEYSMYTGPGPSWAASAGVTPLTTEQIAAVVATTFVLGGAAATAGFIFVPGWRAVATRVLRASPLAFLFSRIDKDEVLENERRNELFEFIRQNPGERLEVVRRRLGLANGTMLHHVKVLCDKDLVRRVKQGGITRLYPAGPKICPKPYLIPQRRMVLQAVVERPGLAQRSIGRKLGMSERMVSYHMRQLAADGLVDVKRDGGRNRCYPGLPVDEIPQLARAEAACPLAARS